MQAPQKIGTSGVVEIIVVKLAAHVRLIHQQQALFESFTHRQRRRMIQRDNGR